MKMTSLFILSFAALAAHVSHAATVHLTRQPHSFHGGEQELIYSGFSGFIGSLRSSAERITMTVDTVADTGSITELEFGVALNEATRETTRTLTSTTVTPPNDFPDPPIITTTTDTYKETVSIDPINLANMAPRFLSSTVGPIAYVGGFQYTFPTSITISFPESFRLTGTYEFQGPQQTDTIPFDVLYTRATGASPVIRNGPAYVTVGTDFPDTGRPGLILNSGVIYRPMTVTLYNGTAGGQPFNVSMRSITIFAAISVPEPTSLCLWAAGLLGVIGTIGRMPRTATDHPIQPIDRSPPSN
jgi:hypothetical protein